MAGDDARSTKARVLLLGRMYHPAGEELLRADAAVRVLTSSEPAAVEDAIRDAAAVCVRYPTRLRGEAIRAGRLPRGTSLPPSRALATDLGVSRGVVVEAYQQLTAEGYLASRSGGYTRVAAGPATPAAPLTQERESTWGRYADLGLAALFFGILALNCVIVLQQLRQHPGAGRAWGRCPDEEEDRMPWERDPDYWKQGRDPWRD